MKTASLNEIKQELKNLSGAELIELCSRLARFKKENKELVTFLLFEAHNEQGYIENVKELIREQFAEINNTNLYYVKKSLRKILRLTNKYIRYAGSKTTEIELLIYFCIQMMEYKIPLKKNQVINNIYEQVLKKINTTLSALHEDLQYDYIRQIANLS